MRFQGMAVIAVLSAGMAYGQTHAAPLPAPADAAFSDGNFVSARAQYSAQLDKNKNDAHALAQLAKLALYDDRLDDAAKLYQEMALIAPGDDQVKRGTKEIDMRRGANGRYSLQAGDVTASLPFVISEPLPVVQLTVNGIPVNFMIDTGAPDIVIDAELAKSIGLKNEDGGVGTFAGGLHAHISKTSIETVKAGDIDVHHVPATIMPLHNAGMFKEVPVGGIIGTSFFYHFLTTIDYARQCLVLRPRGDSEKFEHEAAKRGAVSTRIYYVPDHFIFANLIVNNTYSALLNVDTGGAELGIQATKATIDGAHIALDDAHPGIFTTPAGDVPTIPFTADLAIGSLKKTALPGLYLSKGDQFGMFPFSAGGVVSDKFFRGTAVTFDFEAMRLVVDVQP